MPRRHAPTYHFDFGGGILDGRGLPPQHGRVVRTTEAPGAVSSGPLVYRLDDLPIARSLGRPLSRCAADAIDIAVAVYVADRLAPRHDPALDIPPFEWWPRRLRLRIPVREPDRWNKPGIRDGLERLLAFKTDDEWQVTIVPRSSALPLRPAEFQTHLLSEPVNGTGEVVLHSGGLDGALGLIEVVSRADGTIIPAGVTTSYRLRNVQDCVLHEIGRAFRSQSPDLRGVRLFVRLSSDVPRSEHEPTQRSRAFLYLTVGAVAAYLVGRERFRVAEHGTGAINLPLTPDQFGARTTKAVHPVALALASDLFSLAFDHPMLVDNLLLWETKGQSCQRLSDRLISVARMTVSCDRFPRYEASHACGRCSSCFVRRAALLASGWEKVDVRPYRSFAFDPTQSGLRWDDCRLAPLFALRLQAEHLRHALASPSPIQGLVASFPELRDVMALHDRWALAPTVVEDRLVRLYRAYLEEMDGLFATFATSGWALPAPITDFIPSRLHAAG